MIGRTVSHYRVLELLGSGGPAGVREGQVPRERRRGLAEAQQRTPW